MVFVFAAFVGPFATLFAVEKSRRTEQLLAMQEELATTKKEIALARYQYYVGVNDQKISLKEAMKESKAQYEQLLKEQPELIKKNQTAVTQNIIRPIKTQKVVTQKVPVASSSSSGTPKSSTKTRAS